MAEMSETTGSNKQESWADGEEFTRKIYLQRKSHDKFWTEVTVCGRTQTTYKNQVWAARILPEGERQQ